MVKGGKAAGKAASGIIAKLVKGVCKTAKKPLAKDVTKAAGKDAAKDVTKAAGKDVAKAGEKDIAKAAGSDAAKTTGKDAGRDAEKQAAKADPHAKSKAPGERDATPDPVDVVSGDVFMSQTDVALPGVLPLVLERTHISSYRSGRAFGHSWASTLDMRLEIDADGSAVLVCADGRLLVYRSLPVFGVVLPEAGARWTLAVAPGGYLATDVAAGISWHFATPTTNEAGAAPTTGNGSSAPVGGAVAEPSTGERVLPLVAITHRCGDRIELRYDDHVRVRRLAHSGGYQVSVTWSQDRVVLLSLRQADNTWQPLARFGYTTGLLLAEVLNASELPLRFEYDEAGRLTRWVDRNQFWYGYAYDEQGRCVSSTGSGGYLATRLAYDEAARTTVMTDALGQQTAYVHGSAHRVIRQIDPVGGVTLREWDQFGQLVAETDPTGATARYAFDHAGNLVQASGPDGATATITYTPQQRPATATAADGTVYTYSYDHAGNITSITDPTGAVTRYAWDRAGHLAQVIDPLGAVTTVESDGAGLPVRVTDAVGATTAYLRDAAGRVIREIDPLGAVTTLAYTPEGRPAVRTGPDGAIEAWEYDAEGNLVAHTSPTGALTRFEYTAFDQPVARVEPDGTRLTFAYDPQLRLTAVTNPQGLTWAYSYDPAGRLVGETDYNGRTVSYAHDGAGRLIGHTNGLGQQTRILRDVAGRMVERHTPEGVTRFGYDQASRMTRAVSPSADLAMTYDPVGRLLAETVDGRTITFTYDAAGRRTSRTTPTGVVSTWAYDARHDPATLTTAGHTITFSHDAAGNLTERRLNTRTGWQALRQTFDPAGRLTAQTLLAAAGASGIEPVSGPAAQTRSSVVAHRGYTYRADGHLATITDLAGGTKALTLDPVGRVTAVTAAGWSERYAYDSAGNLAAAAWDTPMAAGAAAADLQPAANSDGAGEIRPRGGELVPAGSGGGSQGERAYAGTLIRRAGRYRFEHDSQGRVILRQRSQHSGKPLTWRYVWDSDDRLTGVVTPDGTRWSYRYDPTGRRLAKYRHAADGSIAEQFDFCWDRMRLVEQTHHRPAEGQGPVVTTWDYEPASFTPITQTERHWLATAPQPEVDQRFYNIVADLTGTPTHLTDSDGQVVWETLQTIWGTQTAVARAGADCPIRLPGQYHDLETGHYYNNQRYYDPTIARYLTQDPLGLQPAPNPATYVNNPTLVIDPLGLAPGQCGTATVTWHPHGTERSNGHATITVTTADGKSLTTHQVIDGWSGHGSPEGFPTTGATVSPWQAESLRRESRQLGFEPVSHTFNLTDAQAARRLQLDSLGANLRDYHGLDNSCVTYCVDILRAGGVDLPAGRRGMLQLKKLLG